MSTTPIYVSTEAYNQAVAYARKHNTSVEQMTEAIILTTIAESTREKPHNANKGMSLPSEKKIKARGMWQNYKVSAETLKMTLGKRAEVSTDDKKSLQQILEEEYESIS